MDIQPYLREAAAKHGPSGYEREISAWLAEKFRPLCDSVDVDPLYNVIAVKKATRGRGKPAVMLCAHQDEIALIAADILPDGTLRMGQVGGVDPRILPASTVTVHCSGKAGETERLQGVVGAKPPHLLDGDEQGYKREDLFVDLGLPLEMVRERVHVGDLITLNGETVELMNGRIAGKTMDDRACIGVMLDAAERLQSITHEADVYFVCASQEEVGCRGARTATYTVNPDLAVVLDVSHAPIPQSKPDSTIPFGAPAATYGPFVQHKLLERLKKTASKHGVTLNTEHAEGRTYTDTDSVQVGREGVPCVLIDLPLKYMHTTVELLDMNALSECGRLLAHFVAELDEGWDDGLWT
ncbi:MAG: M28 family peptidase [Clostridia bacterium]|nr:M28 family peptidase [Clostridia bacterium]